MLRNTKPMEYASSLGYYNYQNYNVDQYSRETAVAYNPNGNFQDVSANATFYQSTKQDANSEKISKYATESTPDFNANVAAHVVPNTSSPPAYSANNPIKPALPTFPWMSYSSEDGKRKRQSYSRRQTLELEKEFCYNEYLTKKRRSELCHMLQLSEKQIKTWFQNRRMKKKKEKEKQVDVPKMEDVEIPTFAETSDSQEYSWDKSVTSSPTVAAEPYKVDHSARFVPDTSQFYFNNPYEVNYT